MSTETHRSMGTGTDATLRLREQGTSTDLPFIKKSIKSSRDQGTSTDGTHHTNEETEEERNNPWRRMVMAATAAARERERMEQMERGGGVQQMAGGRTSVRSTSISPGEFKSSNYTPQYQYQKHGQNKQNKQHHQHHQHHQHRQHRQHHQHHHQPQHQPQQQHYNGSMDSGVQERENDYSVIKDTCQGKVFKAKRACIA